MQQASDKSIIISEILDSRTRNLVSVSRISDYVLSNELVSMALAMVAEDKQINRVLEELFAEEVQFHTPPICSIFPKIEHIIHSSNGHLTFSGLSSTSYPLFLFI